MELTNIKISENTKIITMDIKDLYVNLQIQGIMNAIKYWLNKNENDKGTTKQLIRIIQSIIEQNYFQ